MCVCVCVCVCARVCVGVRDEVRERDVAEGEHQEVDREEEQLVPSEPV
jgi:hypothetical protein